ncbi:MAG: GAF domain-containing protein, partial [Planctomycetota bacterium]|nr:GAF domain-containing protein [Planctomycetota bacterium]
MSAHNEFLDLVSDLKSQLEEKIRLDEINKRILSTLDLNECLQEITAGTRELLNCDRATVYVVVKNEKGERELISRTPVEGGNIKEIRVPYNHDSIAGFVACTGRTLCLKDVYNKSELEAISPLPKFDSSWDKKTGYRSRSMLVAAAIAKERTIGVIQALNKKDNGVFDQHDIEIIEKLASFVAIALQNSQTHTQVLQRREPRKVSIDELLVEKGIISEVKLREAQEKARTQRRKLFEILIEEYDVSEVAITQCMAEINGVEYLAFNQDMHIDASLFENIPEADAKRRLICPYKLTLDQNGEPRLALVMHNPKDFITIEDIEIRTGAKVSKIYMATRHDILAMIQHALHPDKGIVDEAEEGVGDIFDQLAESLGVKKEEEEVEAVNIKEGTREDDAPIVKLCNRIIEDAYRRGATDIHV